MKRAAFRSRAIVSIRPAARSAYFHPERGPGNAEERIAISFELKTPEKEIWRDD